MNQQQDRQEEKQSRRAFFSTLARGGMLALLAFGSGVLISRWEKSDPCDRAYQCGACSLSECCGLPEAGKFRQEKPGSAKTLKSDGRNSR